MAKRARRAAAVAVADLGYGDAGKGSVVDFLVRRLGAPVVVRFNGGPQAAHNVVTPGGRHHTFATWASGTLAGARTFLSRHVYLNPLNAFAEAAHLHALGVRDPFSLLEVDARARIITPWHVAENRILEMARGAGRHGSCGEGFGAAVADALRGVAVTMADTQDTDEAHLAGRLEEVRDRKELILRRDLTDSVTKTRAWQEYFPGDPGALAKVYLKFGAQVSVKGPGALHRHLARGGTSVIFEGAQGVLIDERYGTPPYYTWSDCTFGNVRALVAGTGVHPFRLGVTRTFMVRHGPGPLPTEAPGLFKAPVDKHNRTNAWQGPLRYGRLDFAALRYAIAACGGVDGLAVTHLDHGLPGYAVTGRREVTSYIARRAGAKVALASWGPTWREKMTHLEAP